MINFLLLQFIPEKAPFHQLNGFYNNGAFLAIIISLIDSMLSRNMAPFSEEVNTLFSEISVNHTAVSNSFPMNFHLGINSSCLQNNILNFIV